MATVVSWVLTGLVGILSIAVAIFALEILAALTIPRRETRLRTSGVRQQRVGVLIPAHNEGAGVLPTIGDLQRQLFTGDRLLVVADNCSDDTASVAAAAGAEVIERHDLSRIGKGYALDFGVRHLSANPPEIVIVIDADCRVEDNAISELARSCAHANRPAQALDLMTAPDQSPVNYQIAEFAWRVKNWMRPLGLSALNLPCQLMGTGMAFPWDVIRSADIASGDMVEDLKLGLDLAAAGSAPVFCPAAVVRSRFPMSLGGAESQRQRWEHGHIILTLTVVPRFVYLAIAQRNIGLLALALDLAVPPLALLTLILAGAIVVAGVAMLLGGSPAPLIVGVSSMVVLLLCTIIAWAFCAREILPPHRLVSVVPYALGKIGMYLRLMTRSRVRYWIRTDRRK